MNYIKAIFNRLIKQPSMLGLIGALFVLAGLGRPGITIDEPLDVAPGRHYIKTLMTRGVGFFSAAGVKEAFGGNPDHPPAARWVLGLFSCLLEPVEIVLSGSADPTGLYIVSARVGSAVCFGMTIALIARYLARTLGPGAGWIGGLLYLCLPHVFGHAHLAALETVLNLTCTMAILKAIQWRERPGWATAFAMGLCIGLAMLTKIQGWLLLPLISGMVISSLGVGLQQQAKGLTGLALGPLCWFAGWPWMWYETGSRAGSYFQGSVERLHLKVSYFGKIYQDNQLPWHYSLVQSLAAMPPVFVLLLGIGFVSVWRREELRRFRFWTVVPAAILTLFSLPITRYDSDRLLLMIWPAASVVAGLGGWRLVKEMSSRKLPVLITRPLSLVLISLMILPLMKVSPLSYVSPVVGGIGYFESQGMDLNYWGDVIDGELVAKLVRLKQDGTVVSVVPTLHTTQALFLTPVSDLRQGKSFMDQARWREADLIVVYRRKSYWPEGFEEWIEGQPPLYLRKMDGVWLGGIWPGPKMVNHQQTTKK